MMSINTQNNSDNKPTPRSLKHTRKLSVVFSLGLLAGVLIWAKLRLVTDIPRSAYAVPREVEKQPESNQDSELIQIKQVEQIEEQDVDSDLITDPALDKKQTSEKLFEDRPSHLPYP